MPEIGFFELYPSARPPLPAGTYIMAADHDLTATPPNNADGALAVDGTDFTVKILSPRYVMPPNQILSTFPPNAGVGDWRQRLPQIVFKRRTLPWERNPNTKAPLFAFTPETTPPYLALIVLAEGEGTVSGDVPIAECVTPGTPMLDDADVPTGRYLEVRRSIVEKIFPTVEDLALLAHVRKVNLEDTELSLFDDDGYLAVVVANRLPQPGVAPGPGEPVPPKRYTACLVNLEGQLAELPTNVQNESEFTIDMSELVISEMFVGAPEEPTDVLTMNPAVAAHLFKKAPGGAATAAKVERAAPTGIETAAIAYATGPAGNAVISANDNLAATEWVTTGKLTEAANLGIIKYLDPTLRFPMLTSWEFVCTGDGTFESLMMRLHSGMLGTEDELLDPALRPDIAETGHISLDHTTRRGEPAAAWYRGPLVPQPTVRVQPAADGSLALPHTGDQLRRVVPDGHEDLSTAAAFEIGRLLALSRPGVVAALARWRRELFGAARLQQYAVNYIDDLIAGFSAAAVAAPRVLDDLIATQIVTNFSETVRKVLPGATEFPVARRPETLADAPKVMVGLGLDAQLVRQAVREQGIEALATFTPQTAEMSGAPLSEMAEELAVVQGALMGHVEHVAAQATAALIGKSGRRRSDDLDRLINHAASAVDEEEDQP